jgi:hypothetical protein
MLCEHLPRFMREIPEIAAVISSVQTELDLIETAVRTALDNTFAAFADSRGLARHERIHGGDVLARLADRLPYTRHTLADTLAVLYGGNWNHGTSDAPNPMHVDYGNAHLTLFLRLSLEQHIPAVSRLVRGRIPAAVTFDFVLLFTRLGELAPFTYRELEAYTYCQIRKGIFT